MDGVFPQYGGDMALQLVRRCYTLMKHYFSEYVLQLAERTMKIQKALTYDVAPFAAKR
jgi:hypothetical protein